MPNNNSSVNTNSSGNYAGGNGSSSSAATTNQNAQQEMRPGFVKKTNEGLGHKTEKALPLPKGAIWMKASTGGHIPIDKGGRRLTDSDLAAMWAAQKKAEERANPIYFGR